MAFTIKKRCPACNKRVGENGHCANPNCVLYHPVEEAESNAKETTCESVENSEGSK